MQKNSTVGCTSSAAERMAWNASASLAGAVSCCDGSAARTKVMTTSGFAGEASMGRLPLTSTAKAQ